MGSEKYPDENAFDAFIKKHGGSTNAFTSCERVSMFQHYSESCTLICWWLLQYMLYTVKIFKIFPSGTIIVDPK